MSDDHWPLPQERTRIPWGGVAEGEECIRPPGQLALPSLGGVGGLCYHAEAAVLVGLLPLTQVFPPPLVCTQQNGVIRPSEKIVGANTECSKEECPPQACIGVSVGSEGVKKGRSIRLLGGTLQNMPRNATAARYARFFSCGMPSPLVSQMIPSADSRSITSCSATGSTMDLKS